jgi:glycosyltransferase involved in cell wall biosynthesis
MRILVHAAHTSYEYELAKTGFDFYSVYLGGPDNWWDEWQRPLPKNWHKIEKQDINNNYDLCIVGTDVGYEAFKNLEIPIIYKVHCDMNDYDLNGMSNRVKFFVFSNPELANKIKIEDRRKIVVIKNGVDTNLFNKWIGNIINPLSVGNKLPARKDKGYDKILEITKIFRLVLIGVGNDNIDAIKCSSKGLENMASYYRQFRVFFNPANSLPMSSLEAMSTGMPIVSFEPYNLKGLIKNDYNGYIVKDTDEAIEKIRTLLHDYDKAAYLGSNARKEILKQFDSKYFIKNWINIINKCV